MSTAAAIPTAAAAPATAAPISASRLRDAFLSLTAETKYHGYSDRGGIDPRVLDPTNIKNMPQLLQAPGYPHLNKIAGDAQYHLHTLAA
jgi:iron complex outermembrane receptor protein